jgi:hypothetical protein
MLPAQQQLLQTSLVPGAINVLQKYMKVILSPDIMLCIALASGTNALLLFTRRLTSVVVPTVATTNTVTNHAPLIPEAHLVLHHQALW